jgi:hypothetical protein
MGLWASRFFQKKRNFFRYVIVFLALIAKAWFRSIQFSRRMRGIICFEYSGTFGIILLEVLGRGAFYNPCLRWLDVMAVFLIVRHRSKVICSAPGLHYDPIKG